MSMVILPGGQFEEKGLVVNKPMDVKHIANELYFIDNLNNICFVSFVAGTAVGISGGYCI